MKDTSKLMREVYYYNESLWYQVHSCTKHKLINKNGDLKQFIVIDVTKNEVLSKEEYLIKYFSEDFYASPNEIIESLDTLKFKVYKKIKI